MTTLYEAAEALLTNIDHATSAGAWKVQVGSPTYDLIESLRSALAKQDDTTHELSHDQWLAKYADAQKCISQWIAQHSYLNRKAAIDSIKYQARITELEAALAQQQPVTGWQMVPLEPTPTMLATIWAYKHDSLADCYKAILAAAPAPVAQQWEQKPVCWLVNGEISRWNGISGMGYTGPLYTAAPAPQPAQEPVAWIYTSKYAGNQTFITRFASDLTTYKADKVVPLYEKAALQSAQPIDTSPQRVEKTGNGGHDANWYVLDKIGMATLCKDQEDALETAADAFVLAPQNGPYRAVQMVTLDDSPDHIPDAGKMVHIHQWFRTGGMEPGQMRCIACGEWGSTLKEPESADNGFMEWWNSLPCEPSYQEAFAAGARSVKGISVEKGGGSCS